MPVNIDSDAATNFVTTFVVPWTIKIAGVLLALFVAWAVAGWMRQKTLHVLERRKLDLTLSRFCANMVRYLILVGAVLGCLGVFGIETTSFAAVIGGAALAIGLAFQGTLSNFAAGAMLLVFRPFKVGDYVTVAGTSGTVDEIELFTVKLITPDNRVFIIPNSSIFGAVIENVSAQSTRRVDISVTTSVAAELAATRAVLDAAVASVPSIQATPAPAVVLTNLEGGALNWAVRAWVDSADYWTVHQALLCAIKTGLEEAKTPMAIPRMNVQLDK